MFNLNFHLNFYLAKKGKLDKLYFVGSKNFNIDNRKILNDKS